MKLTTLLGVFGIIVLVYQMGCGALVQTPNYNATQCISASDSFFGSNSQINIFGQINATATQIVGAGGIAFIAATTIFPNPYTLFAPLAILIIQYTVLPANIFYIFGIEGIFGNFLTFFFVAMLALAVTGWLKGTET